MTEWLDPDNLEDPENTTQDLLNELANESDEIAGQVEFWPDSVESYMQYKKNTIEFVKARNRRIQSWVEANL